MTVLAAKRAPIFMLVTYKFVVIFVESFLRIFVISDRRT